MINESGTMTGGGGKPRGGRMCIGSGAPKSVDPRAAEAELQVGCPQWLWKGVAHSFSVRACTASRSAQKACPQASLTHPPLAPQAAEAELAASQEALREARAALSDAEADAKNAERMLADLETAIPKVCRRIGAGQGKRA